jgi:hypothetical protein
LASAIVLERANDAGFSRRTTQAKLLDVQSRRVASGHCQLVFATHKGTSLEKRENLEQEVSRAMISGGAPARLIREVTRLGKTSRRPKNHV